MKSNQIKVNSVIEKLARISKANLEIQDRGILNFWIMVDYEEGMSQGVGGIALDTYDKVKDERVGTAYGCEVIRQLLLALDVNDFSEMKGKMIYVLGEGSGLAFTPKGIKTLQLNGGKEVIFSKILADFPVGK